MKKLNQRAPLVFYMGMFVLVMTLFSLNMTGGLYARYLTGATGADEARVAKFDVDSAKTSDVALSIGLDFYDSKKQSDSIEFEVTSSSEVAVEYDVILILPAEMIELIQSEVLIVKLDGNETDKIDAGNRTLTFDGTSFSPYVAQSRIHELTVEIKEGSVIYGDVEIKDTATLRVHVEQID